MSLAYVVVVQDSQGAEWNEHVGTVRPRAFKIFEKLKVELKNDHDTEELRFEVWKAGVLVPHLTLRVDLAPDEEEEEDEEEDEEYEDEYEEEEDDE